MVDWAKKIILKFSSYAEVSPSETGVKIWIRGGWSGANHKVILETVQRVSDKTPAIEVYDSLRYFAVTGAALRGQTAIAERQTELDDLRKEHWPDVKPFTANYEFRSVDAVIDRARKYLAKMPVSVSGQDGSKACFHAACVLVCGFSLNEREAMELLTEWNQGCLPPWSERELLHKIDGAMKTGGDRGYLRNVSENNFDRVSVPSYKLPKAQAEEKPKPPPPIIKSLEESSAKYFARLRDGGERLIELGLPELDFAIGGGAEAGEMILLAARPNHGKSAVALQFVHHWTSQMRPSLFVSEEMSAMSLGKRTVQYATDIHQDQWVSRIDDVEEQVRSHFQDRAPCLIAECCKSAEAAAEAIRKAKAEYGIQCVVVDYAQLLGSKGNGRYEQITNTSVCLRQVTSETGVLMIALVQMSRNIEKRDKFIPMPSDIKDTGQFEQDADAIIFGVWPHRINPENPKNEYQFFVTKNRNREIAMPVVECSFNPVRQRFGEAQPTFEEPDEGYFGEPRRLGGFDR